MLLQCPEMKNAPEMRGVESIYEIEWGSQSAGKP
jgi:hypothetical protein